MINRDSRGKFAKAEAAPFKVGDRVVALKNSPYTGPIIGSTGTILRISNTSRALTLVAFLPYYPDGLSFYPNEIALAPSTDTETISPDELHHIEPGPVVAHAGTASATEKVKNSGHRVPR